MHRYAPILHIALLTSCGSKESPQDLPKLPAPAIDASTPIDAHVASPYFGDDGAPNAEILAFCRITEHESDVRDISPGVQLLRLDARQCNLEVKPKSPTYGAVLALLRSWSRFDTGQRLDRRNHLTVGFTITPELVRVSWSPYVELETILGAPGRLLVGLDVGRVLGKSHSALRDAVAKPFTIAPCDSNGCSAYGPQFAGGGPLRIHYLRRILAVHIKTTQELLPRVHELITASLGPGHQEGPDNVHVHTKDGVRYVVEDWDNAPVVEVTIEKM